MRRGLWIFVSAAVLALPAGRAAPLRAQGTTEPVVRDTNVGYIDFAIPGDVVRLQFDAAYDNIRPTRDVFFWSPGPPFGDGPRIPEASVDYQDIGSYFETLVAPRTSVFAMVPVRFLNPELNPNTAGLGDVNAGIKHAFFTSETTVASFQFRTYAPSADVDRGLGTGHVSLEPGLLIFTRLSDLWTAEAELRDWIPIGGGDFAGNIIRYGVGVHYHGLPACGCPVVPIAEFVGWTPLDGLVAARQPDGTVKIREAAGSTIVNVKVGARLKLLEAGDVYLGYGRPLTGDTWYADTFRIELRLFY